MSADPVRLTPADAGRYARFRLRMLHDSPWAFASSPEDDMAVEVPRVAALLGERENAVLAIAAASPVGDGERAASDADAELVAAAGIMRNKRIKFTHRALLWGVFVDPASRGRGYGRRVVTAALALAREWPDIDFVDLGVSERAVEAQRLYERLGFAAWGREPESMQVDGRRYDEIYMTLRLPRSTAGEGA